VKVFTYSSSVSNEERAQTAPRLELHQNLKVKMLHPENMRRFTEPNYSIHFEGRT
jgi:hypothetical protein